ncbi:MAG TPA: MFS transporter [Jatrophihabitans sp.]|jgi:MFS family permease|uniref:MFS transporter n=1 Tax=Jatrophihabitans sp. TaxID=1932789 RepID=UPI002DF7CA90|nr:MFS transporter [Jatrophihabitans sp.]
MTAEPRSALPGWLLASSVYFLALLHRTSLGVAGLLAQQRFGITPAQLSVFIFVQLGVYAAMQVPTGIMVDRYGPRRLLVTASLIMGSAQLIFATVPSYPAALVARALLGAGDALTFISVVRFAATHFDPRRFPLIVAGTGMLGTLGNIVATLPLALLLHSAGWTYGFGSAAVLSLVAAAAVFALLPDSTPPPRAVHGFAELRIGVRAVGTRVRSAWSLPGTRLGFWVHFASMSTATAFGVLWGSPYLIRSAGFSPSGAGAVLMCGVILAAVVSPVFGWLIGVRPIARVPICLAMCGLTITGFVVLATAFGDHPPRAYVVTLFVVMTVGGPVSMAAFALARDYNNARTLGTASGVVNVGGFVATVIIALGIGWVLDAMGGTTPHNLRWAVLVAVAVQLLGAIRLAVWWRRVRHFALTEQRHGRDVPVTVIRHRWDLPV